MFAYTTAPQTMPLAYDPAEYIPLKQVVDIVPDLRHNNAMRTVDMLAQQSVFSHVTQIEYLFHANNGAAQTLITYLLTKRQSIIYAATVSNSLLRYIVEYWQQYAESTGRTPYNIACLNIELNHYLDVSAKFQNAYNVLAQYDEYTELGSNIEFSPYQLPIKVSELVSLNSITANLDVRHNNAKRVVEQLVQSADPAFGQVYAGSYVTAMGNTYPTYMLDSTQALMVAARLDLPTLCEFVDFWLSREAVGLSPLDTLLKLQSAIAQAKTDAYESVHIYNDAVNYGVNQY